MKKFVACLITTFIKTFVESSIGVLMGWLLVSIVCGIFGRIDS